ncbi:hypothetical protein KIN20_005242 [Parelaphostrongylus tenuis]|uniref:Uncharacterized protein n=1 Tax=Parelaphostrongylus tenuis TaxID=148309 RepID=A0AAD5QIG0_PARTN|nr:hypothetical protein KIN20_005242 [Parelaphostrongylus tenuis]
MNDELVLNVFVWLANGPRKLSSLSSLSLGIDHSSTTTTTMTKTLLGLIVADENRRLSSK